MKQKHFTLLLLAGIICINVFAQPTIKTQRVVGGSTYDGEAHMTLTKDGGLLVGGTSFSNISGEKTENCRGGDDYWIVKLNSSRNIQWDKTIGGSEFDILTCLQQTNDGGYILGGFSRSNASGEKSENNRGSENTHDYWVVKLDSLRQVQWDKTIGGSADDWLTSLEQTNDGGYILGGWSGSNISGEKTENTRGAIDYWVVKLDSTGKIKWDKTIGGTSTDMLTTILQTNDGSYILGGYSASNISNEKTEKSRGGYDYWIVRLDSTGKIQWDKTIGGRLNDNLKSIQQTRDGGYILGGYSNSKISDEKTEGNRGGADYWIVKLDSTGKIEWDKTIGGTGDDELNSLQQTNDDGFILGGRSASNISWEKSENSRGLRDYWVVKLNRKGKIQWDKTIGGGNEDYLFTVKEVKPNHFVLAGDSGSGISGDKTRPSRGSYDYWLVWLNYKKPATIAANTVENANSLTVHTPAKSFTIYPNPAKDILHIQNTGKATYTIINQSGKIVLAKIIEKNSSINMAKLPAGLYYVKNSRTGEVEKVVVEK